MYCPKCGLEVDEQDIFCKGCGYALKSQMEQTPAYQASLEEGRKSKLVAGLLQIFLPTFAVGRFYLGYYKIAIVQIIVSLVTCGIGLLWPIVDGIFIICGKVPTDAEGRPLKD
jgi:TM2 domain-containing membrane protein YozV